RVRLGLTVRPRSDRDVDVEPVVLDEGAEIPAGVRDETDPQPVATQLLEHGKRVLEELEVVRVLPEGDHLDGALADAGPRSAHAADDVLGEGDPELVVVLELRVALEIRLRRVAGVVVAPRIEDELEPCAEPPVPLRPELGTGSNEREVDVEEDRAERLRHAQRIA